MNILINVSAALRFTVLDNPGDVHEHLIGMDAVSLTGGKSTELSSGGVVAFDDLLGIFSAHVSGSFVSEGGKRGVDYDLLLRHIEVYKDNLYGLHLKQLSGYSIVVEAWRDCYVSRFSVEISNLFSSFDSDGRAEFERRVQSPPGSADTYYSESLDIADFYSQWCSVVS